MANGAADPNANQLLASLSRTDATQIAPFLRLVSLDQGVVINEPGDEVQHIHFPHSGMISLLAVMGDGRAVETATVGREGAVGAMAGLGLHVTSTRSVVQTPLVSSEIAAVSFRKLVLTSDRWRELIVHNTEMLLVQAQITAACNALHPIVARLARWILQTQDRVESAAVPLTQELLSEMLGVRRSSISEVAGALQASGLISYSRGSITIVNRRGLEAAACECYQTIRQQIARHRR